MNRSERLTIYYFKDSIWLITQNNILVFLASLDIAEAREIEREEFMGVDLGIIKLMVDSFGNEASGALIEQIRQNNAAKIIAYRAKEMKKWPPSIGLSQSVSGSSS